MRAETPYIDWIETYSGAEFQELEVQIEQLLDRVAGDTPAVRDAYRYAMECELRFFAAPLEDRGESFTRILPLRWGAGRCSSTTERLALSAQFEEHHEFSLALLIPEFAMFHDERGVAFGCDGSTGRDQQGQLSVNHAGIVCPVTDRIHFLF